MSILLRLAQTGSYKAVSWIL